MFKSWPIYMGPEVLELEETLASNVGVRHCTSCSSGTDALLLLLMAKKIVQVLLMQ